MREKLFEARTSTNSTPDTSHVITDGTKVNLIVQDLRKLRSRPEQQHEEVEVGSNRQ
jgi:hypothetical protein